MHNDQYVYVYTYIYIYVIRSLNRTCLVHFPLLRTICTVLFVHAGLNFSASQFLLTHNCGGPSHLPLAGKLSEDIPCPSIFSSLNIFTTLRLICSFLLFRLNCLYLGLIYVTCQCYFALPLECCKLVTAIRLSIDC